MVKNEWSGALTVVINAADKNRCIRQACAIPRCRLIFCQLAFDGGRGEKKLIGYDACM